MRINQVDAGGMGAWAAKGSVAELSRRQPRGSFRGAVGHFDRGTCGLLEAPIARFLLKLAAPNLCPFEPAPNRD
jgi:hypothetical protein